MYSALVSPPLHPLPRVLVIDDEATVRLGCVIALRADGWQAEGEGSSLTALRRLTVERERFDVLVVDYAMPEFDGLAFTAALNANSHPPILLASAQANGAVTVAALRLGIWDFQAKPLIPSELRHRARRLLTRAADAAQPNGWVPRALQHCQRLAWTDALRELYAAPAECRDETTELLIGLVSQLAGDDAGAREAFKRAHWWPDWQQHDAEIWTELARRLG